MVFEKQRVLFVQQVPLVTCVFRVLKDGIAVTKMSFALDAKLDITQKIVDNLSACRAMQVNMYRVIPFKQAQTVHTKKI